MEKYTNQEKTWIKDLGSHSTTLIVQTIKEIRHHGSIKLLPHLFDLFQPSTHKSIRDSIIQLISELKVQDSVPYIVGALKTRDMGEYYTPLVAACWQSGLDFSKYLAFFIDIFIEQDYQTAIESFSVIEESISQVPVAKKKEFIRLLDKRAAEVSSEKYPLYLELVKLITDFQGEY